MARALVTKLRIPDTAAQTRKSPVARSGRAEASCHDISNTWLAHGYSSSSLTTPATQSALCGSYTAPQKMHDILTRLAKCRVDTRPGQCGASNLQGADRRAQRGLGKPETFNFFGFTFICERNSRGQFLVKRITRRDRMRATLREIKEELRRRMHQPIPEQGAWIEQVVR